MGYCEQLHSKVNQLVISNCYSAPSIACQLYEVVLSAQHPTQCVTLYANCQQDPYLNETENCILPLRITTCHKYVYVYSFSAFQCLLIGQPSH